MKCFTAQDIIEVKAPGIDAVVIDGSRWTEVLDLHPGFKSMPVAEVFRILSLCQASVVTPLSSLLAAIYFSTDGLARLRTPAEFLGTSAFYVHAVGVIKAEITLIDKMKAREQKVEDAIRAAKR